MVDVNQLPPDAMAVRILRRDATYHERVHTGVDMVEPIRLLDGQFDKSFFDNTVKVRHTYSYIAEFYYHNADTTRTAAEALINVVTFARDKNLVTISSAVQSVTDNSPDFTFSLETSIPEESANFVKSLLEENNINEFFLDDEQKERDKFSDILAYYISRQNLTTGQAESFGMTSNPSFSDAALGRASGVSPLAFGNVYRYTVHLCQRAPETLFASFKKTAKDRNGREYKYSPFYFMHPIVKRTGNIPTKLSLKTNHTETPMQFGYKGNVTTVTADFSKDKPSVHVASVKKIQRNLAAITWQTEGDLAEVDHFICIRQAIAGNSIIAKAHTHTNNNVFRLFHALDGDDIGEITYKIIPVFNDYSTGPAMQTNPIIYVT